MLLGVSCDATESRRRHDLLELRVVGTILYEYYSKNGHFPQNLRDVANVRDDPEGHVMALLKRSKSFTYDGSVALKDSRPVLVVEIDGDKLTLMPDGSVR